MPYIESQRRAEISKGYSEQTAGELNYSITKLIQSYINRRGLTYQHINDVVGALEGAKTEFQRRIVNPYEDSKIEENGDVY